MRWHEVDQSAPSRTEQRAVAVASVLAAVALLAPVFGSGALLNLDLVVTRHFELSPGFFGIGPELPRLTPLELPLAVLTSLFGSATTKLFLVGSVALGIAGTHRFARASGASVGPAAASAVLYGVGPFMITRVAVGHLTIVGAAALLPWVIGPLTDPQIDRRRFTLGAAAMALCGFYGGMIGALLIGAGHLAQREVPKAGRVGLFLMVNLPWLVPGTLVLASAGSIGGADLFPSGVDEPVDILGLLVGRGFWQDPAQVGGDTGIVAAILAVVVICCATVGFVVADQRRRGPLLILILLPTALVLWAATPGLDDGFGELTKLGPLAALREPQRLMVIPVFIMAIWFATGATAVGRRLPEVWRPAAIVAPLAVALVLAAPSPPHVRDHLGPVVLPPEWEQAREEIRAEPGSVLVLPWERYMNLGLADNRRVLNPALGFFGAEVLVPADLGLDGISTERTDPRIDAVESILGDLRGPSADATVLSVLGIDWVLVLHEIDYEKHLVLLDDPSLDSRIAAGSLDLLRVTRATGRAETVDGAARQLRPWGNVMARVDTADDLVLDRPYQWGWMRGFQPGIEYDDGRLRVNGGASLIWYWPAAAVVFLDLATALAIAGVVASARRVADSVHGLAPPVTAP